jgi:hypothetical protein
MDLGRRSMQLAVALAVAMVATISAHAMAQTDGDSQDGVAVHEISVGAGLAVLRQSDLANDKLGTGVGSGASVAVLVTRRVAIQITLWLPAYTVWSRSEFGSAEIRDRLVSVTAVRRRTQGHVRPYVLAGAAVGREDERSRAVTAAAARVHREKIGWIELGVGGEVVLSARLAVAPEIRVDTQVIANIVRPGVALIYRLH